MRKIVPAAAGAAAFCASTMAAAAPAPTEKAQAPSAFVQCDGMKGHASAGEIFGQLIAVPATAGLAGGAFNKGQDISKRLAGRDGAAACDLAIADESDEARRVQL